VDSISSSERMTVVETIEIGTAIEHGIEANDFLHPLDGRHPYKPSCAKM
jgi:hypothetical protein